MGKRGGRAGVGQEEGESVTEERWKQWRDRGDEVDRGKKKC